MMKRTAFLLIAVLSAGSAFADGFICRSFREPIEIQIYNHVHPDLGTRNAAVMIVADLSQAHGDQSIAIFRDQNRTLTNSGASYFGRIDRRINGQFRNGASLLGRDLSELRSIRVDVNYRFGERLPNNARRSAILSVVSKKAELFNAKLLCKRYLKRAPK